MSIQVNPRQVVGYILIAIGLLLLGYTIFMAIGLFSGTIEVIQVGEEIISASNSLLLGVMIQIGMLAIMLIGSSFLIKYGIQVCSEKANA